MPVCGVGLGKVDDSPRFGLSGEGARDIVNDE